MLNDNIVTNVFFFWDFRFVKNVILLLLVSMFFSNACRKANACLVRNWFIDVTDHPLVGGLCVDNNTPLNVRCSVSMKVSEPCPVIQTKPLNGLIHNGPVNNSPTGPPLFSYVGSSPVGSTVNATFTLEALCCCNNAGSLSGCVPAKGAKNVWELKTTLVTQKPVINTFGFYMQSSDWRITSINCCP